MREDARRLAEINEPYADFLARIDGQIPRLRVAALGVSDWEDPLRAEAVRRAGFRLGGRSRGQSVESR